MKAIDELVVVRKEGHSKISTLIWRGRVYRITAIEDRWQLCDKWWLTGKAISRDYFRIAAAPAGGGELLHADIYRQSSTWRLSHICD